MEPPPELLAPPPAGDSVHLEAHVSGESRVNQAGRDLHLHYQDRVHGARRVKPGAQALECPYPGLASFSREQAKWFFGRDELTSDLITRLDARLSTGGVQVVVAPSGAGKSSLLHAGLLPQLDSDALPGSSRWPTMVLTPTARPLATLATQPSVHREGEAAYRAAYGLAGPALDDSGAGPAWDGWNREDTLAIEYAYRYGPEYDVVR